MKRKRIFLLSLAILLVILLVACSTNTTGGKSNDSSYAKTTDKKEPVTIRFWNGWTGSDRKLLEELVEYFNKNNKDNITIKMDIMEHAVLSQKITAALVSNDAPELYLGQANTDYAKEGQLVPIDDIFEKTSLKKEDFIEDVLENMYFNGHLYGLPFQISAVYMYWNKDLFKEAGLDPEKPPETWDEYKEFAIKLNNPEKNIAGSGFIYTNAWSMAPLLLSYGGKIVEKEGDKFVAVLTDPRYKENNLAALKWLKELADSKALTTSEERDPMFFAGTIALYSTGAWLIEGCEERNMNFGISLLPAGPKGRVSCTFPVAMVILKGTEGRRLEAAYKFMEYWHNNVDNELIDKSPAYQWSKELGYQPYLYSVKNDEELNKDPIFKITSSYADYYQPYFPEGFYKYMSLGSDVIQPLGENIVELGMPVEEALEDAQKRLEEIINKMY